MRDQIGKSLSGRGISERADRKLSVGMTERSDRKLSVREKKD
jgi:hypothetical protein